MSGFRGPLVSLDRPIVAGTCRKGFKLKIVWICLGTRKSIYQCHQPAPNHDGVELGSETCDHFLIRKLIKFGFVLTSTEVFWPPINSNETFAKSVLDVTTWSAAAALHLTCTRIEAHEHVDDISKKAWHQRKNNIVYFKDLERTNKLADWRIKSQDRDIIQSHLPPSILSILSET